MLTFLLLVLSALFSAQAEQNESPVEVRFFGVPTDLALKFFNGVECPPNYTSIVNQGELTFTRGEQAFRIRKPIDNLQQLQCQNSSLCDQPDFVIDRIVCDNKAADEVWRCKALGDPSRRFSDPIIDCEQDLDPKFRSGFCMLDGSCVLRYTITSGLSTFAIIALVAASIGLVAVVGMLVVRYHRKSR